MTILISSRYFVYLALHFYNYTLSILFYIKLYFYEMRMAYLINKTVAEVEEPHAGEFHLPLFYLQYKL